MGSCQSLPHSDGKAEPKQKGKPQLIIKSFTWTRDSHGLFDYESKTLTKKTMKTMNQGRLVRRGNDVLINKETEPLNTNNKDVLKLNVRDGNFWVGSCIDRSSKKDVRIEDWEDNDHSVWLVVKSFKPHGSNKFGYKLNEGDLIKLGRIKFRVKELRSAPGAPSKKPTSDQLDKALHTDEEANSPVNKEYERKGSKVSDAGSRISTTQTCRICLGDTAEADDPFFSPCHCSGTMKYIHVLCLQRWLKSKLHVKSTGFSTSVYWKTLECELCKVTFPSTFEISGKKFDVVEIDRPDCGYLMMEILSKEKNILRGIHIIKMEGKSNIKLGRGHDSDIRITDISVSRCHAMIKLDKGNFYLEDNSSKFGTLVHFRKPIPLVGDFNNISLQVGRTVLSLTVKKNWRSLGWFGGSTIREPVEIEEEEELFSKENESRAQPESLSRRPLSMDEPHEVGSFENDHRAREIGLPSPIQQQGEEQAMEEDRISNLSEEDFPEAELPENEEQPAEVIRPEGPAPANANNQVSQPQSQQAVAVPVVEENLGNAEQQQAGNNHEVELVH